MVDDPNSADAIKKATDATNANTEAVNKNTEAKSSSNDQVKRGQELLRSHTKSQLEDIDAAEKAKFATEEATKAKSQSLSKIAAVTAALFAFSNATSDSNKISQEAQDAFDGMATGAGNAGDMLDRIGGNVKNFAEAMIGMTDVSSSVTAGFASIGSVSNDAAKSGLGNMANGFATITSVADSFISKLPGVS